MSALTAIDLYVNPNALLPALQGALDASGYFGVVSIDVYPGNPVPGPGPSFPAGIVVINITITQTNAQSIKLHYQDCQTNTPLDVIDCCINESDSTLIHDNLDIDYTDLYYQEIEYTGLDINRIEIGGDCSIGLLRNDYFYDADHRITHMKSTLFNPDPIPDVYNTTYTYSPAGNILSLRRKGFVGLDGNDDPIFAQIDKLLYTYHQDIPSKLIKVEDSDQLTHQPKGFFPLVSEYDYDANGNLVEDSGKDLEIDYNLLNLPTYIFNTDTHDEMLFEYAFGGEKLKKVSIIDDTTRTRLYMGGFEFLDDEPEAFHHAEGRIVLTDSLPRFQFKIADHLGNTVVLFEDKDNSGTISTVIPQDPEDAEVVQRNLYYPFGMQLEGTWKHLTDPQMNYTYNNKEWENDLGLGWLFYGFRCADPAIGRFTGIDPISDQFAWVSPFNYAENSPIAHIDLWGLQLVDPPKPGESSDNSNPWSSPFPETNHSIDKYGGYLLPEVEVVGKRETSVKAAYVEASADAGFGLSANILTLTVDENSAAKHGSWDGGTAIDFFSTNLTGSTTPSFELIGTTVGNLQLTGFANGNITQSLVGLNIFTANGSFGMFLNAKTTKVVGTSGSSNLDGQLWGVSLGAGVFAGDGNMTLGTFNSSTRVRSPLFNFSDSLNYAQRNAHLHSKFSSFIKKHDVSE